MQKKYIHLTFTGAGLNVACGFNLENTLESKNFITHQIDQTTCPLCKKVMEEVEKIREVTIKNAQ